MTGDARALEAFLGRVAFDFDASDSAMLAGSTAKRDMNFLAI